MMMANGNVNKVADFIKTWLPLATGLGFVIVWLVTLSVQLDAMAADYAEHKKHCVQWADVMVLREKVNHIEADVTEIHLDVKELLKRGDPCVP